MSTSPRVAASPRSTARPGLAPRGAIALLFAALAAVAAVAAGPLASAPARAAELPQDHVYQRVLRDHLATLKEADFVVEVSGRPPRVAPSLDDAYRDWLWSRNETAIQYNGAHIPSRSFVLSSIETPAAVMRPTADPAEIARLATWDHPANLFHGSPGLRRRAMVLAIIDMVMHDQLHEKNPEAGANRSDFLGGTLLWLTYPYPAFRDLLPPEAQKAYEAGLRKLIARMGSWGPRGSMTDMDLFAPVSLAYAARVLDDRELERVGRKYSEPLFTDPRYFRKAGYFVDNGCYDTSYNGISLYFASWAGHLVDWPFVHDAVGRAFRLRGHMSLPEPGGDWFSGPTHMSSRTSGDPPHDQWNWPYRNAGAAMLTDEALCIAPVPPEAELREAPALLASQVKANADALAAAPDPAKPTQPGLAPWRENHWAQANFAAEYYKPGFYTRLAKLRAANDPRTLPPFLRREDFVENFDDTLLIAKLGSLGAIIHTGPVAPDDRRWRRPRGFGGGALSGFWTPQTGPVILGRRRGIQGATFDTYDDWRIWPTHAITGLTAAGKPISSSRTLDPKAQYHVQPGRARIQVTGLFNGHAGAILIGDPKADPVAAQPAAAATDASVLRGSISYRREFDLSASGLSIESSATGDGQDPLAELYEVIPVFFGDRPSVDAKVVIAFRSQGKWIDAQAADAPAVDAVRVDRLNGSILITLDAPRRVRLSPAPWTDGYQTGATCRNIMIHLLDKPGPLAGKGVRLSYKITPQARPATTPPAAANAGTPRP